MILASAAELGEFAGRTIGVVGIEAMLCVRAYALGASVADWQERRRLTSPKTQSSGDLKTGDDLCVSSPSRSS